MTRWHVWGDFVHTLPDRIGEATLAARDDPSARASANASGFDFERRLHNGFEPWAAVFESATEADSPFADSPIVRGWRRL
ncbi:MAG: hypothetical protein ACREMP_00125 [Candidatus Tyrphobacter sp.]